MEVVMAFVKAASDTEQWGVFELELLGAEEGNPYTEIELEAEFRHADGQAVRVRGFYDGDGIYHIRFMPDAVGAWHYRSYSNSAALDGFEGAFACNHPSGNNRGPVRVRGGYHFEYADGTRYVPVGTTSYGWAHQPEGLAEETLRSLAASPFNKIRMCVLPHYSPFSAANIPCYPYVGEPLEEWQYERFNPAYFRIIERRVEALLALGIEADIILFHPYNKQWGFDRMPPEADDAFVRYTMSRLGAYRNVWWSLANEYDFMAGKTTDDWDRIGRMVADNDPYGRLCSMHNGFVMYEHWKPWITHVCVQDGQAVAAPGRAVLLRRVYGKPVIYDEVCYEGNLHFVWGRLSAEELVSRFWRGLAEGTYVGHGEVLRPTNESVDRVWTGIGGTLRGSSEERLGFLREIAEAGPAEGLEPIDEWFCTGVAGRPGSYYLFYFGEERAESWTFELPGKDFQLAEGTTFTVDVIDTWNMTIERSPVAFEAVRKGEYGYGDIYNRRVELPGKPYIALRITAVEEAEDPASKEE